jgi:hypothetical protein
VEQKCSWHFMGIYSGFRRCLYTSNGIHNDIMGYLCVYIYLEPKRPAEIGQTRVLKKVQVSLKSTALCKILDFGHFQESSRNL